MIQRKQTLFLLLALILTIVCLCLPLGNFISGDTIGEKSTMYNLWISRPNGSHDFSVWALFAIQLITCPISLIAIFTYRNRIAQGRYCMFNILLCLGWYAVFAVMLFTIKDMSHDFTPSLTTVFPAISIILYLMARKAILADEALVRSADRIR